MSQDKKPNYCYYVPVSQDASNGFQISKVIENTAGHFPMKNSQNLMNFPNLETAEHFARRLNDTIGVTPEEACHIVFSSLRAGKV